MMKHKVLTYHSHNKRRSEDYNLSKLRTLCTSLDLCKAAKANCKNCNIISNQIVLRDQLKLGGLNKISLTIVGAYCIGLSFLNPTQKKMAMIQ